MTWSYSGDPASSQKDEVRFLMGDTDSTDQLILDAEINYALGAQPDPTLAAALVLRSLAAKYARFANEKIGDVSENASDLSKAFAARAKELDPAGQTLGSSLLVLPSFGGQYISEKQTLEEDTDAVQPSFSRGQHDYPGGPDAIGTTVDSSEDF
jgi:hypothetical protein